MVTGASRGIGAAVAAALCAEGARVLLVARGAEELEEACARAGPLATPLALDVRSGGAAEQVATTCAERFGGADVLVNNAGTSANRRLEALTDDEWREQLELSVTGPLRLMRALVPAMAERGWGRVVNVASSAGKQPAASNGAYSVAKAAQLALSRTFADAYASRGVLVNSIAPGRVETPLRMGPGGMVDQAAERDGVSRASALEAMAAAVPLGRMAAPEEVAAVVALLCSERAANVTGAAWSVDGGLGAG